MDKVYLISGLGADYRLFKNICLPGYDVTYAHWIEPEPSDTLATYASKLIDAYHIKPGAIVIGVSLGGMLTIEIAKQVSLRKAILISSIKTSTEAPWYFGLFRKLPIYKIIPGKLYTSLGILIKPIFGHMDAADETLFKSMLSSSSPLFLRWAMGAVLDWRNTIQLPNVYQIIGNRDLVFNYKRTKDAAIVKGGTHIMVFDKAAEIYAWLKDILR